MTYAPNEIAGFKALPGRRTGFSARLFSRALPAVLLFTAISAYPQAQAATAVRFSGAVSGLVTDAAGKPQSGAAVALFNQQEILLGRVYTDLSGGFSFGDLLPDTYSLKVSLASFVPASRDRVQVQSGMRSLLQVSLSKMFSTIQVVSVVPAPGGLMSDDWKWTLRSDPSVRPVLRYLPGEMARLPRIENGTGVFHDSTGMVRISASQGLQADAASEEADLGTQFAFATSFYEGNRVRVSGDVGFAPATGIPGAAIRTTYTRNIAGDSPTVSLMVRQMNLPSRVGQSLFGAGDGSVPALRSVTVSANDQAKISDSLTLRYGSEMDNISFIERLQYFSPWAMLTWAAPRGHLDLVFTSGNARPGLQSQTEGLQGELDALSTAPRLSEKDGHIKVQRGDDYEVAYSVDAGSMEYRVSGHRQYVSNATLMVANPGENLLNGDLLPSLFTSTASFNAGNLSSYGYEISATRRLGSQYHVTASYGTLGVVAPGRGLTGGPAVTDADSLRRSISVENRRAVTLLASGAIRHTGTRFVASYQYSDLAGAAPLVSFSTQPDRAEPGLNFAIHQPIPVGLGMPWRMEATADIRNLLAQGYLPLTVADGQSMLIVSNPRVFRGGLAFVF